MAYVDASALTKLVLEEPESTAMRGWFVENEHVLCSRIGLVETRRTAAKHAHDTTHLDTILASVDVVEFDIDIARLAATIAPVTLKTLGAIHLASAVRLGPVIDAFVTYDDRLATAARAAGLPVVRPA